MYNTYIIYIYMGGRKKSRMDVSLVYAFDCGG